MTNAECRMKTKKGCLSRLHSAFIIRHSALFAEGSAAAAPAQPALTTSLATLLTSHILQDGEIVLLILKPSLWYVLISCLRFLATVLIFIIASILLDDRLPSKSIVYIDVGIFLMAGRVMWSALNWMGRVYVLTDRRIVTLSGVFTIDIFDCPLRRVARTRILYSTRERLLRLGTIQIIPGDEELPDGLWQMIAKPLEVHEAIVAAINRTKVGGC